MTATIIRYKIALRHSRFAWKYGYEGRLETGETFAWGDHPLDSLRRLLKQKGATVITETWKSSAPNGAT